MTVKEFFKIVSYDAYEIYNQHGHKICEYDYYQKFGEYTDIVKTIKHCKILSICTEPMQLKKYSPMYTRFIISIKKKGKKKK